MKMKKVAAVILLALLAGGLPAQDIRVVVPYLGAATNVYENRLRHRLATRSSWRASSSSG